MNQKNREIKWGLEGVYVTTTKLSKVNGVEGKLTIAGYTLEDLALQASFEEIMFLLWYDFLPNKDELEQLIKQMKSYRELPEITYTLLKQSAEKNSHPMDALKLAISTLIIDVGNIENLSQIENIELAKRLVSVFPTIIANYYRILQNKDPVKPNNYLNHAANFLYMVNNKVPEKEVSRALEVYLNTVGDHGLNASTFVARAIVSTDSDMLSGVLGALGSLKGPAHGGAPGPALDMFFEIGSLENTENYIRAKLDNNERIMGFGHRVYKVRDPRAFVLSKAAEQLYKGDEVKFYQMVLEMEEIIIRLLEEYKPGRNLKANVELFTALVLHGCGLKPDIFSSIFAMGRVGGWTAHILEQMKNNRLIRPRAEYSGTYDRKWIPIDNR